ncbi:MAG: acyl-CoA dehydrogenase family protein [Dehalococcoidia bacterium]
MDLGLSEAQAMLQRGAREVLERECPPRRVRDVEERLDGHDATLWRQLAELGWLGLTLPESVGGLAASFEDQAVLAEELGRALVPGPFVETCAILPRLLDEAHPAQRARLLPKIADGTLLAAIALSEADASWNEGDVRLTVHDDSEALILDGLKAFVGYGPVANLLIVAARHDDGVSALLVEADTAGVTIEPIPSMTGVPLAEVRFTSVHVASEARLAGGWQTLQRALDAGAVMAAAYQVGAATAVLDLTVEYAKSRIAFGRPIGSFQAIQHKLVGMLNHLDGARLATWEAAWKLDDDAPDASISASLANYLASEGLRESCFEAHEVHAGVGFMVDYDLQLFYPRAKWIEQLLGQPVHHRDRIVAALV